MSDCPFFDGTQQQGVVVQHEIHVLHLVEHIEGGDRTLVFPVHIIDDKMDLPLLIIGIGQPRALRIPGHERIMRLQHFFVGADTAFVEHFAVHEIFVEHHFVLAPFEFHNGIGLTLRGGVGRKMKKVFVVVDLFHHGDGSLREIPPAADVLVVDLFFFLHEILQHVLEFLFTDLHGGTVEVAVDAGEV